MKDNRPDGLWKQLSIDAQVVVGSDPATQLYHERLLILADRAVRDPKNPVLMAEFREACNPLIVGGLLMLFVRMAAQAQAEEDDSNSPLAIAAQMSGREILNELGQLLRIDSMIRRGEF